MLVRMSSVRGIADHGSHERHELSVFRVIHSIAGTRLDHGGTSRSVPALCDALGAAGVDWRLVAGTPFDPEVPCNFPVDTSRVCTVRESGRFRQLGVGKGFRQHLTALTSANSFQCLVHDHAVWLPTNHAVAKFCRDAGVKRIVSPRGMLGAWALNHGRWKKKLAWWGYQYRDLLSADAFHATSQQEADEIRALGLTQPIAVIPNGVMFPESSTDRADLPADRSRVMLFLSRIHPKKGLLSLLKAWKEASPNGWQLVLAGPDENGHQKDVEQLAESLGIRSQISFPGNLNDLQKWDWYRKADVFVLPSYSENFGIVVAEALAAGLPVIATLGTPWAELPARRIGWHVPHDVDSLANALTQATSISDEHRRTMGESARAWAHEAFGWAGVAEQMTAFYRSVLAVN
jgi:glycosyltransferase involved in cell wall biosynthesis